MVVAPKSRWAADARLKRIRGIIAEWADTTPEEEEAVADLRALEAELAQAREEKKCPNWLCQFVASPNEMVVHIVEEHCEKIEKERDALRARAEALEEVAGFASAMLAKKQDAIRRHPERPPDPWNQFPVEHLRERLREEIAEWNQTTPGGGVPTGAPCMERGELLDVANFCWFIWSALEKQEALRREPAGEKQERA